MTAPLPLVHVITSLDVGGAQRMLLRLLEHGDRARFSSRVVALVAGCAWEERVRALGIELELLGLARGRPDPRALLRLRTLLARRRPALVQSWLVHADLLATLARPRGTPLAWNLRSAGQAEARAPAARRLAGWACARLSRRPDAVVVNSEAGRRHFEGRGYHPRRWELLPNGFDVERLHPDADDRRAVRAELGIGEADVVAGTFARWHASKGVDVLVDALALLEPGAGPDVVVLAGQGLEPGNAALAERLQAARPRARVLLLGPRDDVGRLYRGLDFYVSPSRFEGFPNVLGEALASGLPCVATEAGDSARVVAGEGLLVPAGDAAALARGLAAMVASGAERRATWGRAGRERVRREYSIQAVVRRYEDLWSELAAGAGRRGT